MRRLFCCSSLDCMSWRFSMVDVDSLSLKLVIYSSIVDDMLCCSWWVSNLLFSLSFSSNPLIFCLSILILAYLSAISISFLVLASLLFFVYLLSIFLICSNSIWILSCNLSSFLILSLLFSTSSLNSLLLLSKDSILFDFYREIFSNYFNLSLYFLIYSTNVLFLL